MNSKTINIITTLLTLFVTFCSIIMLYFGLRMILHIDKVIVEFLTICLFLILLIIIKNDLINWNELNKSTIKEKALFFLILTITIFIAFLVMYISIYIVYETNFCKLLLNFIKILRQHLGLI